MMYTTPVISLRFSQSAERRIQTLLEILGKNCDGSRASAAVRAPLSFFTALGDETLQSMEPFLSCGRLGIIIDSRDGEFLGMQTVKEAEQQLSECASEFKRLFPQLPFQCMPRWHDAHRDEVLQSMRRLSQRCLIEAVNQHIPGFVCWSKDDCSFIPAIIEGSISPGLRRNAGRIRSKINRTHQRIRREMSDAFPPEDKLWNSFLIFEPNDDADAEFQTHMEILETLCEKHLELWDFRNELTGLPSPMDDSQSIYRTEESPIIYRASVALFDPPSMDPRFTAQLFPASFPQSGRRRKSIATVYGQLTACDQRVESPRPEREITSAMPGSALLEEGDFQVNFTGGSIRSIQDGNGIIEFSGGCGASLTSQKNGKQQFHSYETESSFALESPASRGLRHTLKLSIEETQIAGRITHDYLQLEGSRELVIDSYIQHPWMKDGAEILHYCPFELEIWADIRQDELIDFKSSTSDESSRACTLRPAELQWESTGSSTNLLPGYRWIIGRGPVSLGIELIHGKRQRINLPSLIRLSKRQRGVMKLSFLPLGDYIRPDNEMVNGILEHLSLRILPNVKHFSDFGSISRKTLSHIDDPFVIYY